MKVLFRADVQWRYKSIYITIFRLSRA